MTGMEAASCYYSNIIGILIHTCLVLLLRFPFFYPNEVVSIVFSIAVIQCDQEQLKVQGVHYGRKPS